MLITLISTLLCIPYFIWCFTHPEFTGTLNQIGSTVLIGLWIFSIIPGYRYYYLWWKRKMTDGHMRTGIQAYLLYEFIIFPFLCAPAYALVYYVNVFRYKEY